MANLAIFASGKGSNALKLIEHFQTSEKIEVKLLVSDNPHAEILTTVQQYPAIQAVLLPKGTYKDADFLLELMQEHSIDCIILAGYLKLIPAKFIHHFPEKIINIHPSLLPKFGGKGMYGMNVHEAVVAAKEKESGITIHFVDEIFDNGKHIFQAKTSLNEDWTAAQVQQAVLKLEHQHFAQVVENVVLLNDI